VIRPVILLSKDTEDLALPDVCLTRVSSSSTTPTLIADEMRNLASDPAASEALSWCRQRWRVHFGGSSSMAGRAGDQGTLAR
jgi:hypothetical protein